MNATQTPEIVLSDLSGRRHSGRKDERDAQYIATAILTYPDGKRFRVTYHAISGWATFERWSTGYAGQGGYAWRSWSNPPPARVNAAVAVFKPRMDEVRALADAAADDDKRRVIEKFHHDTEKQYAGDMHALLKEIYASGALKLLNDAALDDRTENLLACLGQKAPGEDRG